MAQKDGVRFGVIIDRDDQLRIAGGVWSMVTEDAGTVPDLGNLQIVPVYEQP